MFSANSILFGMFERAPLAAGLIYLLNPAVRYQLGAPNLRLAILWGKIYESCPGVDSQQACRDILIQALAQSAGRKVYNAHDARAWNERERCKR